MRVFTASLATETNTFAPMPTGLSAFTDDGSYFPAGTHPAGMSFFGGPLHAARQRALAQGWTLVEGLVAAAQPGGTTTRVACETLRDQLLADLRAALPVQLVLLGLHGAMVADGYPDCEGDLLTRVRQIVGPGVVVGAELDPHHHLSAAMLAQVVRIAFDAGVGARLPLRIGGKTGPLSGAPLDAGCQVLALQRNMAMAALAGTTQPLGDCALLRVGDAQAGVQVVLVSRRSQAMGTDLFTQLGCDLAAQRIVVVKSSQHFRAAFAPLAVQVLDCAAPGAVTADLRQLPYRHIARPKWPIDP